VGNSYNIPLVLPAMSKLNISVVFIGNDQSLLVWAKLHLPPSGELALYNPIDCRIFSIFFPLHPYCLLLLFLPPTLSFRWKYFQSFFIFIFFFDRQQAVYISSMENFQIYTTDWKYFTTAYDTNFYPPVSREDGGMERGGWRESSEGEREGEREEEQRESLHVLCSLRFYQKGLTPHNH